MTGIAHRHQLLFVGTRNLTATDDRLLRRACERGSLIRLRRGVYLPAVTWEACTVEECYRLRVAGLLEMTPGLTASHESAAALWGVPQPLRSAEPLHVLASGAAGTRTEHGVRRHAVADEGLHVVEEDGLARTTLERTVVDLALTRPFPDAVAAADWALHRGTSRDALVRALDELAPVRGRRKVERVLDFADARAESVGESLSRVRIHELGFPAPELQVLLVDRDGLIGFGDFGWDDLIGEFDGKVKYADPAMLQGRSPSEVVVREKRREDRVRATGRRVTRWLWWDVLPGGALGQILLDTGLRPVRRRAVPDPSGWRAASI
jgi:hypothetical protein